MFLILRILEIRFGISNLGAGGHPVFSPDNMVPSL